ncbi:MAG: DUF3667 domain-containing protein [Bacteroidales bacterium]|nr:DUF3667 domain-containing protein [Bacteroidales bacterium]
MLKKIKDAFRVWLRAFQIWQKLGYLPWTKPKEKAKKKSSEKGKGDFYRGTFDGIPFLNDDAKRTFTHLLLRPGYMIRDYLSGQHERYMAPFTSMIIFFAFFALVSSIVNPEYPRKSAPAKEKVEIQAGDSTAVDSTAVGSVAIDSTAVDSTAIDSTAVDSEPLNPRARKIILGILRFEEHRHILSLDRHPEDVDTPWEASLAALESSLRSRGVYLFLGDFLFMCLAMAMALRKRGLGFSAAAATSAYVLCQFSFFMLFNLLLTWGKSGKIGFFLMAALLIIDYRQLFGETWKGSIRLAIRTGLMYLVVWALLILLLLPLVYLLVQVI